MIPIWRDLLEQGALWSTPPVFTVTLESTTLHLAPPLPTVPPRHTSQAAACSGLTWMHVMAPLFLLFYVLRSLPHVSVLFNPT